MPHVVLPGRITSYDFVSRGAIGWAFKINDRILLKYARDDGSEQFAKENTFFDLFETNGGFPHIVTSFLRVPNANFLAYMSGGSLCDRLQGNQIRNGFKFIAVERKEPLNLVIRWFQELCSAVVWLESLGYVHGDLRSSNFLLDSNDHLKLADFDCMEKFGDDATGNAPPWARVLSADDDMEPGEEQGGFGKNGSRTEQFAIGSNLYHLTYGHEPYEDYEDQGPILVTLMRKKEFPKLENGPLDTIISQCWHNRYKQLGDLLAEAKSLAPMEAVHSMSASEVGRLREECQALIDGGLLTEKNKDKKNK